MAIPPSTIQALVIAQDSAIYNTVAASMFTLWDHCITFGQEVDLIWGSKMTVINTLFYIIRYLTFVIRVVHLVIYTNASGLIHLSQTACVASIWFDAITGLVLFICVETVLVVRVFAFYGRNKTLLAFIVTLFVAEMGAQVAFIALTVPSIDIVPNPLPSTVQPNACLVLSIPSLFSNIWIPGLIFESFLFTLVVVRFIRARMQEGISSTPLLVVFIRDGTWAFGLMFAVLLWGVLTFEITVPMGDAALTWLYSILAFCGTRLILNLRGTVVQREMDPVFHVTNELKTVPGVAFVPSLRAGVTGSAPGIGLSDMGVPKRPSVIEGA